ncbi:MULTISPECIES: TRAP transporter small permease [unclassified Ruegeria]|uniref:TRAP transporter small permease n=1 Tax=unclassified Ruegeria TaxID=2625375 RepID=UPI001489A3B3|nr:MULTISPECIES: TRAP transporter small permease subunit [unclassified Ruegeria]NOD75979.1 TRAP transporter small permease subunit [Ruegeria sp. HKCCD4332]NOD88734.1 TRAP transporter small permease subunit [Ruegeria sp. HKCCD4318]NOE16129.1 TRAP transporter small permease subunit [Ruegeria sp. HKCCD4318-2]NOG09798.1 TRAP transporter small permease subunit [Ruegeria sp. HKCCD4315]
MKAFVKGFSRLTEAIAGGMLAAIFLIFLLQILLRYFFTPAGWTLELIGILWVWVIFFSCAFIVRERDHVKFDIIYLSVPMRVRQVFAMLAAAAIVVGMLYSFLPTWDYIDWMKIRKTSTVRNPFSGEKIPLRTVFSIYAVFMLVVAARYGWLFFDILRNGPPKTELELVVGYNVVDDHPRVDGEYDEEADK